MRPCAQLQAVQCERQHGHLNGVRRIVGSSSGCVLKSIACSLGWYRGLHRPTQPLPLRLLLLEKAHDPSDPDGDRPRGNCRVSLWHSAHHRPTLPIFSELLRVRPGSA